MQQTVIIRSDEAELKASVQKAQIYSAVCYAVAASTSLVGCLLWSSRGNLFFFCCFLISSLIYLISVGLLQKVRPYAGKKSRSFCSWKRSAGTFLLVGGMVLKIFFYAFFLQDVSLNPSKLARPRRMLTEEVRALGSENVVARRPFIPQLRVNGTWFPACSIHTDRNTANLMCKKLGFGTGVLWNEHGRKIYHDHELFYDSDALPIGACPEFASSLDSCDYDYRDEEHYMRGQCSADTTGIVLYIACFDSAEQECLLRPGDRWVWNSEKEVCSTVADFQREQEEEAQERCENLDCSNGYVAFEKWSLNCTCRECKYSESMHGTWSADEGMRGMRPMYKNMIDHVRGSSPDLSMITEGRDEIYAMDSADGTSGY